MTNEQIKIIVQAIEYMKQHLNEDITSEALAYQVGYSPYHFTRVFKEVTGVTPRHYLSALRIEAGKKLLIRSSYSSILSTLLLVGYRSMGTFSAKFKEFVGLSPKQFQMSTAHLHKFINDYEIRGGVKQFATSSPTITCHIEVPGRFQGLIFVGLFPRPIPDQKPIMGTALSHKQTSYTFSEIPCGTYYVLAAALPWSLHPKDYFLLDKSLRGKGDHPLQVKERTTAEIQIKMRKPVPYDPPILINLPKLLFEKDKNKAN